MSVINSLFSAILMYSKIPVPHPEWKEENRRYSLCFFPLIGLITGVLLLFWYYICRRLNIGVILFSTVCTAIPIAVTGGIHLDGFCDVNDAIASWGNREKMLEIMSDSHIGAFAVIRLLVYLIVQTALFSESYNKKIIIIFGFGMVMSRAMSGLAAVKFKSAKSDGMLCVFKKSAHKNVTILSEIVFIVLSACGMIITHYVCGIAAVIGGVIAFIYYRVFSYRKFNGITGDLAGWFLQVCELFILLFAAAAYKIMEALS